MLTSCGEKPDHAPCASDDRFLVFIDKSGSSHAMQLQDENMANFEKAVNSICEKISFGNALTIRFIHKQTDTKDFFSGRMDTKCRPTAKRKLDRIKEEKEIKKKLLDFQENARTHLYNAIEIENQTDTKKESDLWSIFPVMSSFFEGCDTSSRKVVYIVSDLIEYQKGKGRRNFHNKPPKSKEEAELFAREDAKIILHEKEIKPESFESLQVYLLVPNTSLEAHTPPEVIYYWKVLLQAFGVDSIKANL